MAADIQATAVEEGKPVKKRARGRPISPEKLKEEAHRGNVDRLKKLGGRIFGRGMSVPADMASGIWGDHWDLNEEDRYILNEMGEIWLSERFEIQLDNPRYFDYALITVVAMAYFPKFLKHISIMKEKQRAEQSQAQPTGTDLRPGGDGQNNIRPRTPLPLAKSADR